MIELKSKVSSELTNQELLDETKKIKSASIINAFLIGFMIGIVIYSVVKSSLGFFTLIPLFIAFKVFNNPESNKNNEALKEELKTRNLR
jgi:riboflavin transporter FmnP